MVTTSFLFDAMSTFWIWAFLGGFRNQIFRCCFLLHSLLAQKIILSTCLTLVPRHFMSEASFEMTDGAGHNGLGISCLVYLSRITARAKTHCKVWHVSECCEEGFLIISVKSQFQLREVLGERRRFNTFQKLPEKPIP